MNPRTAEDYLDEANTEAASWDAFQQMYFLAAISNAVSGFAWNQHILQIIYDKGVRWGIQHFLPQWEVAWSPTVYKSKPSDVLTGPDNAWFVARCSGLRYPDGSTKDTCVVAIAGTAMFSKFAWKTEDFGITQVVDHSWATNWKKPSDIVKPQPVTNPLPDFNGLAFGTSLGVYNLLTQMPANSPSKQTLVEYLMTLSSNTRVVFTGHSLGGALAPSLALLLSKSGLISNVTDLKVLALAGASPGSARFAKDFSAAFPKESVDSVANMFKVFNANLANIYDIVPRAWDRLQEIPNIYGKVEGLLLREGVKAATNWQLHRVTKSKIAYQSVGLEEFDGGKPLPVYGFASFMSTVVAAHTVPYLKKTGILTTYQAVYSKMAEGADGVDAKKNVDQAARTFPVTNLIIHLPGFPYGDQGNMDEKPFDVVLDASYDEANA